MLCLGTAIAVAFKQGSQSETGNQNNELLVIGFHTGTYFNHRAEPSIFYIPVLNLGTIQLSPEQQIYNLKALISSAASPAFVN